MLSSEHKHENDNEQEHEHSNELKDSVESNQQSIKNQPVILPGSTIGVLGGGQLGRMIALAGRQMGYRFVTLEPTEDSPCGQVADEQIVAAYDDALSAQKLARLCDVITYEFENVDAQVAEMLTSQSYVPQGSELLYTTQHRLREKRAIEAAGVDVAPYAEITSVEQLRTAVQQFGTPCVLKTATGGYDGKGQWVIQSPDEIEAAYESVSRAKTELVLEKFIHFERELSVIAARNPRGEVKVFPAAENVHLHNILHLSIVPARISQHIADEAEKLATQLATSLNVIGLLAVELFLTSDGKLYVNELAPRPHNSGHYTIDACSTSQFEQHVRAICNLPLSSTKLLTPVVMVNILGEHVEPLLQWMGGEHQADQYPQHQSEHQAIDQDQNQDITVKVHLYGKKEAKFQRKMGHVNLLTDSVDKALSWIEQSPIWRN